MKKKIKSKIKEEILRIEGIEKINGTTKFTDDLVFPDMLYGKTIRSTLARGTLKDIIFEESQDINWKEFTIVTAKDIPGLNAISMLEKDWQCLVEMNGSINHYGEAILLIAHKDQTLLEKAASKIKIICDELPAILTIEEALDNAKNKKILLRGEDNLIKQYTINKGDVDIAFNNAKHIIEGEYRTGAQEQLYIENQGMIALGSLESGITVWGSMQCPYYVHGALVELFGLPNEKIRIIQAETGGAFGGKEDYPSLLAAHAALLAMKSKKAVKIIYDRHEDLAVTTKRHPSITKHKTAIDENGKIVAIEIEFLLDGGAYTTVSPVVLSRGMLHSAGVYSSPNVRINAKAVVTNNPPRGAFRGFGAPQSLFALERHIDVVAKKLHMTPEEFRRKNFLKPGCTMSTGQVINENIDYDRLLDITFKESNYKKKVEEFKRFNQENSTIKKGIGFACILHGGGFTGSGEKKLSSVAGLKVDAKNEKVEVLASSTEMGQGRNTIFARITAEMLGINSDDIYTPRPDTSIVPNSGPTVASRTTMIVGKLIETAAFELKQKLIESGFLKNSYDRNAFFKAAKNFEDKFGELKTYTQYKLPSHIKWDETTHTGDAYATYAWSVHLAEVSVDLLTYEIKVDNFYAIQEIGRVVHDLLATGQIEGGVTQGIGYALYEKVIVDKKGQMKNNQMTNYIIPTSIDVPQISVHFEEWNKKYGPGGAKGIGELPMSGPAPAILNAIDNAINISATEIPFLPEDLMNMIQLKSKD